MTDNTTPPDSLLTFPCEFTIKIFGEMSPDFEQMIFKLIHPLAPTLTNGAFQSRISENGKYLSLSVTLYVQSRVQLDQIYQALTSCPQVLMAL